MSEVAWPTIPGLEFVRLLGEGGQAHVFQYSQQMPWRQVAVKVLKDPLPTAEMRDQFLSEANLMASLEHPYIVSVYAAGETGDGRPYLVMQYYPHASLAERLRSSRLRVEEVLRIGIQIGSAVETAHQAGILHRDIKPHNILTNQYGAPGLSDFGIASHVGTAGSVTSFSAPWAPPEVLADDGRASVASDVYSLGATLWHLLVGHSPFADPADVSLGALMRRIIESPVPVTGRPDVPRSLDALLQVSMAKEPDWRPPTAYDLVRSLQGVERELVFSATEAVMPLERVPEWMQPANHSRPPAELTVTQGSTVLRGRPGSMAPLTIGPSADQPTEQPFTAPLDSGSGGVAQESLPVGDTGVALGAAEGSDTGLREVAPSQSLLSKHAPDTDPHKGRRGRIRSTVRPRSLVMAGAVALVVAVAALSIPREPTSSGSALSPVGGSPAPAASSPSAVATPAATATADAARAVGQLARLDSFKLGGGVWDIALDSERGLIYGADSTERMIRVGDLSSGKVKWKIGVPDLRSPYGVAYDPGSSTIYMVNTYSNRVTLIDAGTRRVRARIKVGEMPGDAGVDTVRNLGYVANFISGTVSVIDAAQARVVSTIKVGSGPQKVTVSPESGVALVTNNQGRSVSVIDLETLRVTDTIKVGGQPYSSAVDAQLGLAYVSNSLDGTVSVIDLSRRKVVGTIKTPDQPQGMALDQARGVLYVCTWDGVSVIDVGTREMLGTTKVGEWPSEVELDRESGHIFVLNNDSASVTTLSHG